MNLEGSKIVEDDPATLGDFISDRARQTLENGLHAFLVGIREFSADILHKIGGGGGFARLAGLAGQPEAAQSRKRDLLAGRHRGTQGGGEGLAETGQLVFR